MRRRHRYIRCGQMNAKLRCCAAVRVKEGPGQMSLEQFWSPIRKYGNKCMRAYHNVRLSSVSRLMFWLSWCTHNGRHRIFISWRDEEWRNGNHVPVYLHDRYRQVANGWQECTPQKREVCAEHSRCSFCGELIWLATSKKTRFWEFLEWFNANEWVLNAEVYRHNERPVTS